ncbi:hypothetical protein F5Y02DRAFT_425552 [Annulohypoxylon stygium]|nr:hypothetical protein F5Y02DRAFT_425552 [Annulohypoxylon stygium]
MGKWSRKKEKAIVDYRHRWPTQQTLYESRILGEDAPENRPLSRRDDIDHRAELIESRKRKQYSTSTLSESPERHKPNTKNSKPGRSTHPYDTGVGETSATSVGDSIPPRTSSKNAQRTAKPRGQPAQTPDGLRKSKRHKSTPSLRDSARGHTPQKRDQSNFTPESQIKSDSPSQLKIAFRNILRLDKKNWCNNSDAGLSETASIIPIQAPIEPDVPTESRRRQIWKPKKQDSVPDYERDQRGKPGVAKASSAPDDNGEDDDLLVIGKSQNGWKRLKSRQAGKYQKGETGRTDTPLNTTGRGTGRKDQTYQGTPKTTNYATPSQPDRDSLKKSGRKFQMGRRQSVSSSAAHPSTIGTSSTPGTATAHRDFAQEGWRDTPSPTTPNQILRFLFGPRRTPPSRTTASLDLPEAPKISVSASTPLAGRQSRESRVSGRPSIESKNRFWIPFRLSPRSQLDPSPHDNDEKSSKKEGQGKQLLEPTAGEPEPVPSRPPNVKKPWDKILRKRWRSG